ncbi:site-specific integrase [Lactococcus laudensis]|uniref:site-specific integrase n=2 Tax=Pseudolactococcus laudensis TaxID=1494461 RepID=UPI002FC8131C
MYDWDEIVAEFNIEMQIKGFSEKTIQNYYYKLKKSKMFFESQGIKYIDTITKQDIKKYILFLREEGAQAIYIKGTSNNYQLIHLKMKLEKNTEN